MQSAVATVEQDHTMDSTIEALEKVRVGEVFRSRKNRVYRVTFDGQMLVAKVYPAGGEDRAAREYSILQKTGCRHVRVPRPVKCDGRALLMEYIESKTVTEIIDSSSSDAEPTLLRVIGWLSDFHHAHGLQLCRGDCVLHNFLVAEEGVVGIDFEEAHEGDPIEDLGQVIASYLSMRPAFLESKFLTAERIASEYMTRSGLGRDRDTPHAVSCALRHYAGFREDGDLLRKWADRIECTGLASRDE